jgi:uncharacterized protein (DUF4415 family)
MAKEDIRSYTSEELREIRKRGDFVPTPPDAPVIELDEAFWEKAEEYVAKRRKTSVHLRLDPDVVELFRKDGPGHLTRMANVLKAYANSRRR